MGAFLFSLGLFLVFFLIGFAVLSACLPRLRVAQGILVSPSVGIAATILPVFFINRAGFPVKDFGYILLFALIAFSIAVLVWRRPVFPFRRVLSFASILVVALLLAAWPMFLYGFDWISFSNDDMANYALGAQRFLNNAFFAPPNLDALFEGKDYSEAYWFMHVLGKSRSGSELMLAFVWGFSGQNAHFVFMPTIMALHLALIAGAGALVSGLQTSRRAPLIAMSGMAISPLTTLGALYQLIGQVGGLALLCAAVTLTWRPQDFQSNARFLISQLPAALVFAGLFVWYPEILPFFGLGWICYVGLLFWQRGRGALKVVLPALAVGLIVLAALNKYVVDSFLFLLAQAHGGLQSADLSTVLFPYFLVPSGLAALWGLIPIAGETTEPFLSLSIIFALILFYWLGRKVIWQQVCRVSVPVAMFLVMTVLGILLFVRNNDFGLFKLAMFVQPFLLGMIAIALSMFTRKPGMSWPVKVALALGLILMLGTQSGYVGKSTGEVLGGLNEIPGASSQRVNRQFRDFLLASREQSAGGYVSRAANIVLAKFQSLYSRGESLLFPSRNFFINISDMEVSRSNDSGPVKLAYERAKQENFVTHRLDVNGVENRFSIVAHGEHTLAERSLISTTAKQTIFDDRVDASQKEYFKLVSKPKNDLVFVHSELGNHYYFGDRRKISFYQLEDDPMFSGQRISALGRYFVFLVLGTTERPRMVMELTDTVLKQWDSSLPHPTVQNAKIGFVGRGSGRVFSDRIEPTMIDGMPFLSVDMGRDGKQFQNDIKGLMLLYGRNIPLDQRRITAFGRDMSLISEAEYQALTPPSALTRFPADLENKSVEYSGVYEDGWISERSFFMLASDEKKQLVVSGMIPLLSDPAFSTTVTLSLGGRVIAEKPLGLGKFELAVPVSELRGRQRIDIAFSRYQVLPGQDGRTTGAKIDFLGFR